MNNLEQKLLRYGEFIVDEEYREHIGFNRFDSEDFRYCRIRLISYQGDLYYHKIATGETLEFRKVGKVL